MVRLPEAGGCGTVGHRRRSHKEKIFEAMRISFTIRHVEEGNSWLLQVRGFPRKQISIQSNQEGFYSGVVNQ